MISWIDKADKHEYNDSAPASGIRYKFYDYGDSFDEHSIEEIKKFIAFLRKNYFFPIRLNILFCNTQGFRHHLDNHIYYGAFYGMEDEKRKTYPRITVAAMVAPKNPIENILYTLSHEITHYYQWYFLEEDSRTDRSLEIEANKWANYVVDLYLDTNCLINSPQSEVLI